MKKIILFLFAALLIAGRSFGQSAKGDVITRSAGFLLDTFLDHRESLQIEWEILSVGIPYGIQANEMGVVRSSDRGYTVASEVRFNFMEKKLSAGAQLSLTGWDRLSPDGRSQHTPFAILATGDYNFTDVVPKVVPFAGMGVGCSFLEAWPQNRQHFAIAPRVGAEFFRRIRLTGEYQYLGNGNNFFNIKLGFVIGS
ncbi:MAG: hypothetical protein LBB62_03095 [Proteiniphilum sp.]|jgi:hypothetical protein|nr:hypothetical protein [Proteiniphilum sp.]